MGKSHVWCPGGGQGPCEMQCIMGNSHMGTPCEQTDISENITLLQLRWRAVKILNDINFFLII